MSFRSKLIDKRNNELLEVLDNIPKSKKTSTKKFLELVKKMLLNRYLEDVNSDLLVVNLIPTNDLDLPLLSKYDISDAYLYYLCSKEEINLTIYYNVYKYPEYIFTVNLEQKQEKYIKY